MSSAFPGGNPNDPGYWEVIFDVIPFPVYVADTTTFDIVCANRAMKQRVEINPGDKCYAAIYQQPGPCSFCKMKELEAAAAAGTNYLEFEHFNDLDDHWYQLRETIVAWFDGRRAKYSIAVNISALKEVQNALAEAHAELALKNIRLNGALHSEQEVTLNQRNFLAMVSHEFRMPLSIIGGAAEVLEIYTRGKPEAVEEIGKIDRAVHRMSDLIDVCLADARFTSAVAALQVRTVEIAPLVEEICREKAAFGGPERLHLSIGARTTITADPALLRVALSNLIDNALKYSPAASGPVRVSLESGPTQTVMTVADHGPGIPADEAERVFEKFYRSPSATGTKGAGLGLYIVKQIIESHGGRIEVGAADTGGSKFTITLPMASSPIG
ncbi:Signal transduction histidine kinase [Paramagnetospirillum magnetotacticum MS-1]|uniref:histidine kinase n=1 Tax=Paramagnetospirillum magnetotacticum MS-1 TaxID=272627 RepID=A0A0C2UZP0_PARME|nr:HAMP domain-containing sensor histidine kinase [Paramagnetospirillum magnetotacticum]KIL98291.1 Signal transduction histidine kinase [Paramagnetospirillum magnetotacticum MS-1]